MKFKVVEKFVSINGEGTHAGELAVFIRFAGCNLSCSYCDTRWANERAVSFEWMTIDEIDAYIKSTKISNVTLTGGEPLIQNGVSDLLSHLLMDPMLRIEIETNGSIDISPFLFPNHNGPCFTMDYKLDSSQMENKMIEQNFMHLKQTDTVKFVAGSYKDLDTAEKIILKHDLTKKCNVHLSPVFNQLPMHEMIDFMKEHALNKVRFQPQLHKFIWSPETRGV